MVRSEYKRGDQNERTHVGEVSEDALWRNLENFLREILPLCEQAGVRLAFHPDDPPVSR